MKRFVIVLVAAMLLIANSYAQLLARDGVDRARNACRVYANDVVLRMIASADSNVTTSGTETGWVYSYYSATQNSWYTAVYTSAGAQAFPGGANDPSLTNIPSTFSNSDVAVSTAEGNGGSAFRNSHTAVNLSLVGGSFSNPLVSAGTPVWIAIYAGNRGSTRESMGIFVNMSTGALIGILDVNEPITAQLPSSVALKQNYPNPFNSQTTLQYSLPTSGNVVLSVIDVNGREVATMNQGNQTAGDHSVSFKADAVMPSGQYFVRLQSGKAVRTMPMMYLK